MIMTIVKEKSCKDPEILGREAAENLPEGQEAVGPYLSRDVLVYRNCINSVLQGLEQPS